MFSIYHHYNVLYILTVYISYPSYCQYTDPDDDNRYVETSTMLKKSCVVSEYCVLCYDLTKDFKNISCRIFVERFVTHSVELNIFLLENGNASL